MNIAQRKIAQLVVDLVFYETNHLKDGMLISEETDRIVARFPILGRAVILAAGAIVTLHLSNSVPERFDMMAKSTWRRVLR